MFTNFNQKNGVILSRINPNKEITSYFKLKNISRWTEKK